VEEDEGAEDDRKIAAIDMVSFRGDARGLMFPLSSVLRLL
jgi:hypothetical protein